MSLLVAKPPPPRPIWHLVVRNGHHLVRPDWDVRDTDVVLAGPGWQGDIARLLPVSDRVRA